MLRSRVITARDAAIIAAQEPPEPLAKKATGPAGGPVSEDSYFKKLLTYIPGETVAAYVVASRMTATAKDVPGWELTLIVSAFFAVFTFLWVLFGASDRERELPRPFYQASVSAAAFAIWALAIDGEKLIAGYWHAVYGGLAALGLTMLVPLGDRIFVRTKAPKKKAL